MKTLVVLDLPRFQGVFPKMLGLASLTWLGIYSLLFPLIASLGEISWTELNTSFGGRLQRAFPFSLPCFSTFEGDPSTANSSACAQVQSNYASSPFRAEFYNGFM